MKSVKAVYATLRKGPLSPVSIGTIHGKMEAQERNQVMEEFVQGNIKILIATTIIEVGIDVPNATVLVVENADRYGLSQLHQLRGRVGRSHKKSYCFLHAELEDGSDAQKRLSYFCKHHNGFEIAEMDLSLRGPGDVTGYKQSGWEDLRIADILRDASLFARIQQDLDLVMLKTSTFV
jgi:ATP-dependent DNA helicase RecG